MTFEYRKFKIWLSQERKKLSKRNWKHFSLFNKCSLLDIQKCSGHLQAPVLKLILISYSNLNFFNLLSANFIKWSNTLKKFVGKLPTNCLSVFDHFVGLVLKELKHLKQSYRPHIQSGITKTHNRRVFFHKLIISVACLEHNRTSTRKLFAKIVNDWRSWM